ncbi:Putative glycoside hydrolase family 10 domain, glycoside hydrolase superfamily [Septoria linicola]|uniref:Beta-xylanase n=1 Tax=Septoria linicola TaxID=215465 RepID=A0A9Q9EH00_9PEZI|nr:putative glycoside hydrolase family 10 domain, glycoside hydrolase superfamily [Septoria linicola]USW51301.1 Putative glycoside hydrolase family 10 domain, glycoside hydrolase superfamily [Septoria linicola]
MPSTRSLVACLLALSSHVSAVAVSSNVRTLTTTLLASPTGRQSGLNEAAQAAGKMWFGTAINIPGPQQDDQHYMSEFRSSRDFGQATPANSMKYASTEQQRGSFNFTAAEEFLSVARGKKIRCHNLIWHRDLPDWLATPKVAWTNATLSAVLVRHVQTLVRHFGDRCYSWDVVNEAVAEDQVQDGTIRYRNATESLWYRHIGPEFVPMAFRAAQAVIEEENFQVKLYYNDYGIEKRNQKAYAVERLVRQIQGRGIQIDGIGLESHFAVGETPSSDKQATNMRMFNNLGVEVAVTELDVRTPLPPSAADQLQQCRDYYNTVAACKSVEGCVGVTVWDFVDDASWIPHKFAGHGYANLFFQKDDDSKLLKKVAYDGALAALESRASP